MTHEELKTVQQTQFRILCETADFLNSNGIIFFLVYGTLLGAVRHQAVIPWDNDIDIAMTRKQFELFQNAVYSFPEKYSVNYVCYSSIEFAGLVRITDKNPTVPHSSIDLFIIDNAKTGFIKPIRAFCRFLHIAKLSDKERSFIYERFKDNQLKTIIVKFAEIYNKIFGCALAEKQIFRIAVSKTDSGKSLMLEDIGRIFDSKTIQKSAELPFENKLLPAPIGYTELLRLWYGDYMKIPPEGIEYMKEEAEVSPRRST